MEAPRVTYFVEYPRDRVYPGRRGRVLTELFSSPYPFAQNGKLTIAEKLAQQKASISLAMVTLDRETAEAVRVLNSAGVPVTAWVVVSDQDGYWTNQSNVMATEKAVEDILRWGRSHHLKLARFGFDLELPLYFHNALKKKHLGLIVRAARRYGSLMRQELSRFGDPQKRIERQVEKLHTDGYMTEAYVFPRPGRRILGGTLRVSVQRTVEMLYTSFFPKLLRGTLLGLRDRSTYPALGIVTGTSKNPGRGPGEKRLNIESLTDDTTTVMRQGFGNAAGKTRSLDEIYVFALNGSMVIKQTEDALRQAMQRIS